MVVALIILCLIVLWICLPQSNGKKGFFGIIAALLYFPLGVIFALAKKYK